MTSTSSVSTARGVVAFTARLDRGLVRKLERLARLNMRSRNNELAIAVLNHVEADRHPQ